MKPFCLNSLSPSGLLISAALAVELRPFIDHYRAKRLNHKTPWPVYCSADGGVVLVETGIGASSAAAAVSFAISAFQIPAQWCCINLGLAGSGSFDKGQWVQAHTVCDGVSGFSTYLPIVKSKVIVSGVIRTVASPSADYDSGHVLEMEAAGMLVCAKRFVSLSQIAVLKLIADTCDEERFALNKRVASELFSESYAIIIPILEHYQAISAGEVVATKLPSVPAAIFEKFHATVSQRRQMERAWRSFRVFYPDVDLVEQLGSLQSFKECLNWIHQKLSLIETHWEEA